MITFVRCEGEGEDEVGRCVFVYLTSTLTTSDMTVPGPYEIESDHRFTVLKKNMGMTQLLARPVSLMEEFFHKECYYWLIISTERSDEDESS